MSPGQPLFAYSLYKRTERKIKKGNVQASCAISTRWQRPAPAAALWHARCDPPRRLASAEKLAVRAKPRQSQGVGVGLAIDQQQVGLDVALTVARPIAGKVVIAVACIEGLIGRQCDQHRLERVIKRGAVLALGLALVVAFERGGAVNRPHANPPSDRPH
ncbi:protein of unknown function [Acidithiobacillus ferrivorans]|uniref:Uncharacterized protein n=1 Tax=Acidithiobacillus ferrivorans TaxID=160808 RepID=A0ABY1MR24_9PROT|nr:protein of unknown function [Acidithiobacillus ferrivorans]